MKRRREIRKKRSPSIINKKWRKQQNKIKKSHRRGEEKREKEHKKMKIIKIKNKSILQIKRNIKKKSGKSRALNNFFL